MPIANCFLSSQASDSTPDNLLSLWQEFSGIDSREMTVNIVCSQQLGKPYEISAHLIVPSLWPMATMDRLQLGLSQALGRAFTLEEKKIIVMTQVVHSGRVIESGHEVHW